MTRLLKSEESDRVIRRIVDRTPVFDIHTHLYDPAFDQLQSHGIDELLTYHYLVAETFRCIDMPYAKFWALDKCSQADLVWQTLFVSRSPLSEATRGVVTCLNMLGLDPGPRDLPRIRKWFRQQRETEFLERVLTVAGVRKLVMTNSPFDEKERLPWERGFLRDERFAAALRIDPILHDWPNASRILSARGYQVGVNLTKNTLAEIRRFLADWTKRMNALYVMASLPPEFTYPANTPAVKIVEGSVLPFCREHGLPLALMPGVKSRLVNPELRIAGYGMGRADLDAYERLIGGNLDVKFLLTVLSRENQHQLAVMGRKFRNLHPFGCWWFLNNPVIVEDMTRMRLEMLGLNFTPQHSDARVLDHLLYKWSHFRSTLSEILIEKYTDLLAKGWRVTHKDVERDVALLHGGAFEAFMNRS